MFSGDVIHCWCDIGCVNAYILSSAVSMVYLMVGFFMVQFVLAQCWK